MTTNVDPYTDVVELCALLQCVGFSVKSLETVDGNSSQTEGTRTVIINCQSSGLHVVLESGMTSCSCPSTSQQNSGFWQVSGIARGKQLDKEFGSSLLGSLPKSHRERLSKELHEMLRCIKELNESDIEKPKEGVVNKSASMVELKTTPERSNLLQQKTDTPTRYRSLDTLTTMKCNVEQPLPEPGVLQKLLTTSDVSAEDAKVDNRIMCRRQSTYTLCSTPSSTRRRNKTSSPIRRTQSNVLEDLIIVEKAAEELRNKISLIIKELNDETKNDSSVSSLVLDVSKISVLKGPELSKLQFASSPNLSSLGSVKDDVIKSRLKRFESASTSNLSTSRPSLGKDGSRISKLKRLSPTIFKLKKDSPGAKADKVKPQDNKTSKLNTLFKAKVMTPVRSIKTSESSSSVSASKKKYSHVKSTIPRPSPSTKKD